MATDPAGAPTPHPRPDTGRAHRPPGRSTIGPLLVVAAPARPRGARRDLRRSIWRIVAVTLAVSAACAPTTGPVDTELAEVVRIIDGDTIVARMGGHDYRIRLIGIDTPETHHPSRPVECFGPEATDRIASLIPEGSAVRLERDAELWDLYGRVLAYVFRADDDLFVNLAMVRDGFATTLVIPPNTAHTAALAGAERAAADERLGLWSACADQR